MLLLVSTALSAQAPVPPVAHWQGAVDRAAARFDVPRVWIEEVMRAESGGQAVINGRPIRSTSGAIGLMQIMPNTWQMLRDAYGFGSDADDPDNNIGAGAAYLKRLYTRFGYPALFAAYHSGPTRYQLFLAGRTGLPSTTLTYVRHILAGLHDGSWPVSGTAHTDSEGRQDRLFVDLPEPGSPIGRDAAILHRFSCVSAPSLWAVAPACPITD